MTFSLKLIFLLLPAILIQNISTGHAAALQLLNTEKTIELSNNIEFSYQHFKVEKKIKSSNTIALWVLPGYPHQKRFYEFSQRLSNNGVEVWMVNILDNLFMPKGVNSIRKLDGHYVAELITAMHLKTNKNVILIAESYSAIPVLRGAQQWQLGQPTKRYLTGAVLFSPNLFDAIPSLGKKPEFVDVANYTSIPILLYQSQKSNTRSQLPRLLSSLQKKASVFTSVLHNTIALFYLEDKTPETLQYLQDLPKKIISSLNLLESSPLPLFSNAIKPNTKIKSTQLDSELRPYTANNTPNNINLNDVFGKKFTKSNYKNQITIINFWATWCKPCLEEIPSLNRLKDKMKNKPFEIISINYAEKPETIIAFMKLVNVEYPILIDESGEQAVQWNVFAFPSTFVIGVDGQFKYGVNASIYWDTPEVVATLNKLYKN